MRRADALSVAMLLAIGALLALPFLSGERVFFPFHTDAVSPWNATAPEISSEEPRNVVVGDKHLIIHPDVLFTRSEFEGGHVPLWNPNNYAGLPHQANPLTGIFYPPNLIFAWTDPLRAHGLSMALHVLLAALFAFLFLRTVGVRPAASLFGGLSFAFSGWMAVHLHHAYFVHALVWLPLALLSVEHVLRSRARWAMMTLAISIAFMFLGGFPQTAVINCYLISAWCAVALFRQAARAGFDDAFSRFGLLIGFGVGGLLLAAVQLLPTLDFKREVGHQDISIDHLKGDALKPVSLLHLISPEIFGDPVDDADVEAIETLLLADGDGAVRSNNHSERSFYPGVLVLLLGLLAPLYRRDRRSWTLWLAALASALAATGTPLLDVLARLPGLDFGSPMRFTQVAAFALPMLAAMSLDVLLDRGLRRPRLLQAALLVGGVLLLAPALATLSAWIAPTFSLGHFTRGLAALGVHERFGLGDAPFETLMEHAEAPFRKLRFALTTSLLFLGGAGLFFWSLRSARLGRRTRLAIAFAITLGELLLFGIRFNLPVRGEGLYRETPGIEFLERNLGDARFIRLGGPAVAGWFYSPNAPLVHDLADAQGFRAMTPRSFLAFMDTVEPNPYEHGYAPLADPARLLSPQISLLRVKYAIAPGEVPDCPWPRVFPPAGSSVKAGMVIYENPLPLLPRAALVHQVEVLPRDAMMERFRGLPALGAEARNPFADTVWLEELRRGMRSRYADPDATERVLVVEDRPGFLRLEVQASAGGVLVVSEQFDSGWKADSRVLLPEGGRGPNEKLEILRADGTFLGIPIATGRREVTLRYAPESFRWGGLLSGFALVFLLLVPILPFLGEPRSRLTELPGRGPSGGGA